MEGSVRTEVRQELSRSWVGRALRCHVRILLFEVINHSKSRHNWISVVAS